MRKVSTQGKGPTWRSEPEKDKENTTAKGEPGVGVKA